jgi:His/Glu/Gln/Arg/opine family amino acid ABC transporter permease subunit
MTILDILTSYYPAFLKGLYVTLQLSMIVWLSGILIGGALGLAGSKFTHLIGIPSRILSFILSGIPIIVFLFWLHYPAQAMLNIVIDPFYTAALTLSIINIFAVSDIVRGALIDFPKQYLTAAKVAGLSKKQTIFNIQLPLILRQVIPSILLLQVTMLHTTLFASLISVEEIFRVAQRINAQIYRPVEIYTALGLFFLLVCLPINGFAFWLKKRFTRNLSEQ